MNLLDTTNVKKTILLSICLAGLSAAGCEDARRGKFTQEEMANIPFARRTDLPIPSGRLVLSVSNETITVDEIVTPVLQVYRPQPGTQQEAFRQRARPLVREAVVGKITDVLLYKEARKQAPDNVDDMLETAVRKEVRRFVAAYGNNYADAERELTERGLDWEKFRDFQKKLLLVQSYYASQNLMDDRPISHSEMLAMYDAMQHDDYEFKGMVRREDVSWQGYVQFSLIDIKPDRLRPDEIDTENGQTPREAALAKAAALLEKIRAGEDFAELAKAHSHDHRAAMGGLWTPVNEGSSLVPAYAPVTLTAQRMEIGQVAGPIESAGSVFIVRLEDKRVGGTTPFHVLQPKIEMDIQLIRRRERFDKLINRLMDQANVTGLDPFVDFCVERAWTKWQNEQTFTSSPNTDR